MEELKPFPKYKNSGVTWIGEIPREWEVTKLKFVSKVISGYSFKSDDYTDEGIPVIRIGDISNNINLENTKKVILENEDRFKGYFIKYGDILIAMTGATIGKTAVYKSYEKSVLNQRVGIFRSKSNFDNRYLSYIISSDVFNGPVKFIGYGGAQENIGTNDLENIFVPIPRLKNQKEIGQYLDQKTSQIDSLIADKERLIELLEEKRQAVITETVTKGLDPDVKMKDSGIEWIGEIPEHWVLGKVGYVYEITLGKMIQPKLKNQEDQLVPYLKANNIQDGYISYSNVDKMYANVKELQRYELKYGDLLVCEGGDVARSAFVEEELECYIFQNALHRLRGSNKGDVRYLHYLLNIIRNTGYIDILVNRATIAHFTRDKFSSLKIPIPTLNEQKEIENFVQKEETKINNIKKDINLQISKLKEYRESLIYEAVTGKIDVRDYVAEAEEVH